MGRVISLDYGLARIGVAATDERKIIASPLCVIQAEKSVPKNVYKVLETIAPYTVELVIIGLPMHLDGRKGTIADVVLQFINYFKTKSTIPIIPWEERLSTREAERALSDMSRKKRSQIIDSTTAAILLQSYLGTV